MKSNGRSFIYQLSAPGNNVGFEKIIDDSNEITSKVTNEFDEGYNPYALLDFTDPFFTNYSTNNKVKINSEYFKNLPQSVVSEYAYEYNEKNLPLRQITTYVSYPNGNLVGKAETIFEYED